MRKHKIEVYNQPLFYTKVEKVLRTVNEKAHREMKIELMEKAYDCYKEMNTRRDCRFIIDNR